MKIIKLQAENVKKLKAVEITPDSNVIKITGRNEQGKTTVLDSIWWALGGTKDIQELPIRAGEKSASITLDLGEYVVIRTFSPAGSYLKVENKTGATFKSPQALLDNLIGKYSFDPLAFAKAEKSKQVETLLNIVDLKADRTKLKEIAGYEPRQDINPLAMINEAYKFVYDERTVVNRDLERTKKVLESLPKDVTKTERVSLAELVSEKERLQSENTENDKKRKAVFNQLHAAANVENHIFDLKKQIREIQQQLAYEEAALVKEIELYSAVMTDTGILTDNDLTEINEKISKADETNTKAEEWEKQEKTIRDVMEFQQEADALNKKLNQIKDYKQELISNTKFPITGLDFGNGGILYNGIPFEQASSAQKLQVSLAIAMALKPDLKVIRIDDGSLLDSNHMKIIEEMANANDFQIWMEVVDESGKVGVYMEDGEVKTQVNEKSA